MTLKYTDPSFDTLEAVLEKQYDLPSGLMSAIRTRGEKSNNNQVSPKGAKGVYQFIPATWVKFADPGTVPTDPEAAAIAAARYLSYGMKRYGGDIGAVAAEYNGGPKAAKAYLRNGDPGNKETRLYVQRVLDNSTGPALRSYEAATPKGTPTAPLLSGGTMEVYASRQTPQSSLFGEGDVTYEDISQGGDTLTASNAYTSQGNFETGFTVPDMDSVKDTELENEIGRIVDGVING